MYTEEKIHWKIHWKNRLEYACNVERKTTNKMPELPNWFSPNDRCDF